MSVSLLLMAIILAVVASPHCISMCGCGLAKRWLTPACKAEGRFLLGRFIGYSLMGGVVGGASQVMIYWASGQVALFNALHWILISVMAFSSLIVLWQAKPIVVGQGLLLAQLKSSQKVLFKPLKPRSALPVGVMWWLLPCGVLYSAFVLAYLSGSALQGSVIMALFAAVSSLSLLFSSRLQVWMRRRFSDSVVYRFNAVIILSGLALMMVRQAGWVDTPQIFSTLGLCL